MADDVSFEDELDDLDDLIHYLEKEKDRLKRCVDDAAEQWHFSEARVFAKAHKSISKRLHVLKTLRDPGFDERARHYQKLILLEEDLKIHADAPHLVRHLTEQITAINQALDRLEKARYSLIDTQHVDDAIFLLVNGTINGFNLHLNKNEELVFALTCEDAQLHIGISYKKDGLSPGVKKRLRRIGFQKVVASRRFVRTIDVGNFKGVQKIKQLLAVVLFDVFGQSWLDNPAALEIIYKTTIEPN